MQNDNVQQQLLCFIVAMKRQSNLKFETNTSTKNTHQIPKSQINISEA